MEPLPEKQTPFRLAPAGRREKATLVLHSFLWSLKMALQVFSPYLRNYRAEHLGKHLPAHAHMSAQVAIPQNDDFSVVVLSFCHSCISLE